MTANDYSVGQKVIHWLMAIVIILDLFVAQKFGDFLEDWDRLESRSDHATLGTIVTVLFVFRIYLRIRHGAPALPESMTQWQVNLARWTHVLFYFLIGFLVLSGIVTAINAAAPIYLFGAVEITIGQSDESLFQLLRPFHEFATNAVIVMIVLHILAALYHAFVMRDDTTSNMLKFWKRV